MTQDILTPSERRQIQLEAAAAKEIRDAAPSRPMKPWCISCAAHVYSHMPPRTRFFDKVVNSFCDRHGEWLEWRSR